MCFFGQNRHQLKDEDKGLSLLCLSIRVCRSTRCIKKPSGFFSKPATLVGPLHFRAFVPPSISPFHHRSHPPPPLRPPLSVCNGPDEEGGKKKTKEVREMEEWSEKKRASGRNWRVKEGRDKRRREESEGESGGGGERGDTGARCAGGKRRPSL